MRKTKLTFMPNGITPEQAVTDLNLFFNDNPEYAMDLMRVRELAGIVYNQILANVKQNTKKRCPFEHLLEGQFTPEF